MDLGDEGGAAIGILIGIPALVVAAPVLLVMALLGYCDPPRAPEASVKAEIVAAATPLGLQELDKMEKCATCCGDSGAHAEGYKFKGINSEHRMIAGAACKKGDGWIVGYKLQ